jgi:hypothetical protein
MKDITITYICTALLLLIYLLVLNTFSGIYVGAYFICVTIIAVYFKFKSELMLPFFTGMGIAFLLAALPHFIK